MEHLDEALSSLRWPAGLHVAVVRLGLSTVRDLVILSPSSLSQWLCSPETVAETRVVLEALLGTTWETARARELVDPRNPSARRTARLDKAHYDPRVWEQLRQQLGSRLADIWVRDVFRIQHVKRLERIGVHTLGDLLENHRVLFASGYLTHDRMGRLADALARVPPDPLATSTTWLEALESAMGGSSPQAKQLISVRAGLDAEPLTWRRTAEALAVCVKRANQIEDLAIRKMRFGEWHLRVDARLVAVVQSHALSLGDLGGRDPFFRVDPARESAFAWFVNRLVCGAIRVSSIRGERVAAHR
jgi:hypothetical protein